MVKVKSDLKTYSANTSVPKFNLMNQSLAEIENDLEYLLFVEHGEDMVNYTHLRPLIQEMAKVVVQHSDRAVRDFQRDMTYRLASRFKNEAGAMIFGEQIEVYKKMRVDTTIDDKGVVGQAMVERDAPVEDIKPTGGHHDW